MAAAAEDSGGGAGIQAGTTVATHTPGSNSLTLSKKTTSAVGSFAQAVSTSGVGNNAPLVQTTVGAAATAPAKHARQDATPGA